MISALLFERGKAVAETLRIHGSSVLHPSVCQPSASEIDWYTASRADLGPRPYNWILRPQANERA